MTLIFFEGISLYNKIALKCSGSCSTVERTPCDQVVVSSNPTGCWALCSPLFLSLSALRSSVSLKRASLHKKMPLMVAVGLKIKPYRYRRKTPWVTSLSSCSVWLDNRCLWPKFTWWATPPVSLSSISSLIQWPINSVSEISLPLHSVIQKVLWVQVSRVAFPT